MLKSRSAVRLVLIATAALMIWGAGLTETSYAQTPTASLSGGVMQERCLPGVGCFVWRTYCATWTTNEWVLTVTNGATNSDVRLKKFRNQVQFFDGIVGATDGSGVFQMATPPDSTVGTYSAYVEVAGQASNNVTWLVGVGTVCD